MKKLKTTLLAIPLLLTACGGGSGEDNSPAQPIAGAENNPLGVFTSPEAGPGPDPAPQTPSPLLDDANSGLGPISELIGRVGFGYGYTGTQSVFGVGIVFSETSLSSSATGGPILSGVASTSVRFSPNAATTIGPQEFFACAYIDSSDLFFCTLDPSGTLLTYFLMPRLTGNQSVGVFEYCGRDADAACIASLTSSSPDGAAVLVVSAPQAADARSLLPAQPTDLTPYLQYMEQGTESEASQTLDNQATELLQAAKTLRQLEAVQ